MGKWDKYLDGPSESQVCKLCKQSLKKNKTGATSGYLYHFKTKHPKEYQKVVGSISTAVATEPEAKKARVQPTLKESFIQWGEDGSKSSDIERCIMQMICVDKMPLQTPNKPGFTNLMKVLSPRFNLKDRSYYTRVALPLLFNEYMHKLKMELEVVQHVAISIDLWSDKSLKHEVLGATVHFLNRQGRPDHRILSCIDTSQVKHTGINISEMVTKLSDDFGLEGKIVALLRDGASNVKLAGRLLNFPSWDCWSHKLNLVAKTGTSSFSELDNLIERVKKVIRKIRKSSTTKKEFEQIQDSLDLPHRSLVKNIDVRWNTLHAMFHRFQQLKGPLDLLLASHPEWGQFDDNDWSLISATIELLHPIVRSSELSQNRCALSSSIIPTIKIMMRELSKPATFAAPRAAMLSKLKVALEEYKQSEYLRIATSIDPRFRMAFGDGAEKDLLIRILGEELPSSQELSGQEPSHEFVADEETNPFQEFLKESAAALPHSVTADVNAEISILAEVEKWSKGTPVPSTDPFEFWSSPINQAQFPKISKLVPHYLCAPPGSSETERMFSTAGNILNDNRKSLSKENFNSLLFLGINIPLIGFER